MSKSESDLTDDELKELSSIKINLEIYGYSADVLMKKAEESDTDLTEFICKLIQTITTNDGMIDAILDEDE